MNLNNLTPKQKKYAVYGGMGVAATAMFLVMQTQRESQRDPIRLDPVATSLTGGVDTRSVSLDALARRQQEIEEALAGNGQSVEDSMEGMRRAIDALTAKVGIVEGTADGAAPISAAQEQSDRIAYLEQSLLDMQKTLANQAANPTVVYQEPDQTVDQPKVTAPQVALPEPTPVAPAPVQENQVALLYEPAPAAPLSSRPGNGAPTSAAGEIRIYEGEPDEASSAYQIPPLIIPPGSIITSYLLTGVDAPTGVEASEEPLPILMRIKRDAIMPNLAYADVVDCHMLGSAYGDLASERVMIRGEIASCILYDGTVFETKAKFFAVGEDGKNGVRGNLVSRAGVALANAAKAGFGEGLATALGGVTSPDNLTVGGLMGSAASSASASAFTQLAEYYIDLAEQAHPVVEITNGRWVDVVLTGGLTINFDEENES